jgi:hypothetical protein
MTANKSSQKASIYLTRPNQRQRPETAKGHQLHELTRSIWRWSATYPSQNTSTLLFGAKRLWFLTFPRFIFCGRNYHMLLCYTFLFMQRDGRARCWSWYQRLYGLVRNKSITLDSQKSPTIFLAYLGSIALFYSYRSWPRVYSKGMQLTGSYWSYFMVGQTWVCWEFKSLINTW